MSRSGRIALAGTVVVAGIALRAALVWSAPRWGYAWDHFSVIGMGLAARENGLTRVYSLTHEQVPTVSGLVVGADGPVSVRHRNPFPPNYPPLSQLVLWLQATWLASGPEPLVANTLWTRVVTSVVPVVAEAVTALGVLMLVRLLSPRRGLAAVAAGATWLSPPLMMNTAHWSQVDSLVLAPALFLVLAMARRRWLWAGVATGVALLLKPQALLLLPVAGFGALLGAAEEPQGPLRAVLRRLALMGAANAGVVAVVSAPWMLADGLAWIRRCYQMNLLEILPYTTLEAFNVWYLHALLAERTPIHDVLLSTASLAGLTRDAWGRLAVAVSLALVGTIVWWRHRRTPELALVLFAMLWLWSATIWPTRVHERYILYCLPFAIAAAAVASRLRPPVLALLLVATVQYAWPIWRSGPPAGTFDRAWVERVHEGWVREHAARAREASIVPDAGSFMSPPSLEDTRAAAFERYRAARRPYHGVDWVMTLLSLGGYAWAVGVVMAPPRAPSGRTVRR